jgi:predicted lipoprotein with Yx(FWY)xxD motif
MIMKKTTLVLLLVVLTLIVGGCSAYPNSTPAVNQPVANLNQPETNVNQPATALGVVPGTGAPLIQVSTKASFGDFFVGNNNMTLYFRTNDGVNQSNCTGSCATIWPPLLAPEIPPVAANVTGTIGLTNRADGTRQVTYNGWPLYYYSGDLSAGDTNGQGVAGVWYVASLKLNASAKASTPPVNSSSATPPSSNYSY